MKILEELPSLQSLEVYCEELRDTVHVKLPGLKYLRVMVDHSWTGTDYLCLQADNVEEAEIIGSDHIILSDASKLRILHVPGIEDLGFYYPELKILKLDKLSLKMGRLKTNGFPKLGLIHYVGKATLSDFSEYTSFYGKL